MRRPSDRIINWLIALALAAVVAACYWQVRDFGLLHYDDPENIKLNVRVQNGLSLENVRWAFTTRYANFRMPLVWISLMTDREIISFLSARGVRLGPGNVGVYHLTNVFLHAAAGLLLFVALLRMTGFRWRSAFVAALFGIHPLHVESVAWATGRKDVLSGLFWMLTMLAYSSYVRAPRSRRYVVLLAVFALGLMAKPMLVTLPIVLFLLDYWPLGRLRSAADVRRLIWEKAPLLVLTLIASAFADSAQQKGGALPPTDAYPMGVRIANALVSYVIYIQKTIWPEGLIPFYPHPAKTLPVLLVVASGVCLAAATTLAILAARTKPYVLAGWLWYGVTLLPVIGLVQVGNHARADRYTYLPLTGLFIIAAWGIPDLAARFTKRNLRTPYAVAAAACAALCAFTVVCHRQVGYWRNDLTLFRHTLRVSPNNAVAYNDLGIALAEQGKTEDSIKHFRRALDIWPDYALAYNNLGCTLEGLGRLDEAIENYEAAILVSRSAAANADTFSNLGRALAKRGRYSEAVQRLSEALEINPDAPGARNDLGRALELQGKADEAETAFRDELRVNPGNADAHVNLGRILTDRGNSSEAVSHFQAAVRLKPKWAAARVRLADALAADGKTGEAIAEYRRCLRLGIGRAAAANGLAWVLATTPDPAYANAQEALILAEEASRLTRNADPSALDTLAAAYARASRFKEAVETARKAAQLASSTGKLDLARQIRQRLRLFEMGRPYTEIRG